MAWESWGHTLSQAAPTAVALGSCHKQHKACCANIQTMAQKNRTCTLCTTNSCMRAASCHLMAQGPGQVAHAYALEAERKKVMASNSLKVTLVALDCLFLGEAPEECWAMGHLQCCAWLGLMAASCVRIGTDW